MKFEQYKEQLINACEELGLMFSDESKFNYDSENHKTLKLRGIAEKPVYSGCIYDFITIDKDDSENKGLIDVLVNGNSYQMEYSPELDGVQFSKAKVDLNGMYWCLSEEERNPITEKTFKSAITRFMDRNK